MWQCWQSSSWKVPGTLKGQDVYYAPSITDDSTTPLVGNDHLPPWVHQSICILVIAGWRSRPGDQGRVDGDDVKPCVGEHGRLWR